MVRHESAAVAYLAAAKNLSLSLLHFPQHRCKVPEARLRLQTVWGKDSHLIDRLHSHLVRGHHTPEHFVLLQLENKTKAFRVAKL